MIKDLNELKEFVNWARENGVKKAKLGDIEVELELLAPSLEKKLNSDEVQKMYEAYTEGLKQQSDEQDLFWSAL